MKQLFAMTVVVLAIAMAGCQKANDTTRIGTTGPRSGGVTANSVPANMTLSGFVWRDPSGQATFQQAVKDFLEAQMDPKYVGTVSGQQQNQTGMFVGAHVEFTNGQPYNPNTYAGRLDIAPNSEILVAVYDSFQNESNAPMLPVTYVRQAQGYVQNNQLFVDFDDQYGKIRLQGPISGQTLKLTMSFQTKVTFDGHQGYSGTLGDLYIPTCQFFRCQ